MLWRQGGLKSTGVRFTMLTQAETHSRDLTDFSTVSLVHPAPTSRRSFPSSQSNQPLPPPPPPFLHSRTPNLQRNNRRRPRPHLLLLRKIRPASETALCTATRVHHETAARSGAAGGVTVGVYECGGEKEGVCFYELGFGGFLGGRCALVVFDVVSPTRSRISRLNAQKKYNERCARLRHLRAEKSAATDVFFVLYTESMNLSLKST